MPVIWNTPLIHSAVGIKISPLLIGMVIIPWRTLTNK